MDIPTGKDEPVDLNNITLEYNPNEFANISNNQNNTNLNTFNKDTVCLNEAIIPLLND